MKNEAYGQTAYGQTKVKIPLSDLLTFFFIVDYLHETYLHENSSFLIRHYVKIIVLFGKVRILLNNIVFQNYCSSLIVVTRRQTFIFIYIVCIGD